MKGRIIVIKVDGSVKTTEYDEMPSLDELKSSIGGGWLETVPRFSSYEHEPAVAFCDEEGKLKNLPVNISATQYWYEATGTMIPDVLCGDIAIVQGDSEFMEAL